MNTTSKAIIIVYWHNNNNQYSCHVLCVQAQTTTSEPLGKRPSHWVVRREKTALLSPHISTFPAITEISHACNNLFAILRILYM